ncbi:MAG: tRNA dihydrouridine synthase DusB [Thermodesulfobacteriota bacterium]
MRIGPLTLDNPFILAPLAGYTDLAFRLLCREYGAGLCYSEMISCFGMHFRQPKTLALTATVAEERPVAMQLFGTEPEIMAEAAAMLSELPIDIIDLNMGCPVRKVVRKGAGCALMKTPELAERIIRAVKQQTHLPLTVKFRAGWTHQSITACDFARMAEANGADAVIVHGRTWSDGFGGRANWGVIREVKQAVRIPVIGNGDVQGREEGLRRMEETGCDGIMIGRGALGRPWIFSPGAEENPPLAERLAALDRYLALLGRFYPMEEMLPRLRNLAGRFFKGYPGSTEIRKEVYGATSLPELLSILQKLGATAG